MIIIYVLVGVVGACLALALGYRFGLGQFQDHLAGAVATATADARADVDRHAAAETVMHTILLDGITESGKTTFIARLAFPCTDRKQLENLRATARHYLTRPLPLWFDWPERAPAAAAAAAAAGEPPERVHSLRFNDVSGERARSVVNAINALAAETARKGRVAALWVWDMSNTPKNHKHLDFDRLDACYGSDNARKLIKHVVVFFNKVDLLDMSAAELEERLEIERAYIRDMAKKVFDEGLELTFHHGSAIEGLGVFETYGALLHALGFRQQFAMLDSPAGSP